MHKFNNLMGMNFPRIKELLCFIVIMHAVPATACAQYPGYTDISDINSFKKTFAFESRRISTISSDFTQEKTLTALTEKITSTGKFWFKRSNKVRLEYIHPFVYLMILDGTRMLIRDHQKESRINTRSSKVFQQLNNIVLECVQGTILDSKDFKSRVYQNEKMLLLEMKPISKSLRGFFETIILVVDKRDYSAASIRLNEPQGDITIITFSNKKLNEQIPDTVFAL